MRATRRALTLLVLTLVLAAPHGVAYVPGWNGPYAEFNYTRANNQSFTITVNATNSSDNTGTLVNYTWEWGDENYNPPNRPAGSCDAGNQTHWGIVATHTYKCFNRYWILLTVTDDAGKTNTKTHSFSPYADQPPVVELNATVSNATVTLNIAGSYDPDGDVVRYNWSWGDGVNETTPPDVTRMSHTYAASGTYTIVVLAYDNGGRFGGTTWKPAVKLATDGAPPPTDATPPPTETTPPTDVTPPDGSGSSDEPPDARFSVDVQNLTVTVAASSPRTGARYAWDWGDGSSLDGAATARHAYAGPGTFTIALRVTTSDGQTAGALHTLLLQAPPSDATPVTTNQTIPTKVTTTNVLPTVTPAPLDRASTNDTPTTTSAPPAHRAPGAGLALLLAAVAAAAVALGLPRRR